MRKISNLIVVLSALILGFTAVGSYASESMPYGWDRSYQVREIVGAWVMNHDGKYLGKVQDFVFDPDGHVVFAIIGYSRFNWRMIGENSVAVPFPLLGYDRSAKRPTVVVDISLEKFRSAPRFTKDELTSRLQEEEVYRYFGQQPYWHEKGSARAR